MIWECVFGPSLYKFYETTWKSYEPRGLERWGDNVIALFAAFWSIGIYVFPFIPVYTRNYTLAENAQSLMRFAAGAGMILVTSLAARGYARAHDPTYVKFVRTLNSVNANYETQKKHQLLKYDFDFKSWPVDYTNTAPPPRKLARVDWVYKRDGITLLFCKLAAYVVAHTVALKLMYPGSITVINWAMKAALLQGRIDLLKLGGERFKLIASDTNSIDAMFVDRRNKAENGNLLVITCEGNCGFYEIGIISTPLDKGYSVLGWNHPGFGYSTGQPYPMQEQAAIECVMNFAIEKLGFPVERVMLYGWSIGGYTATYAASNYSGINSLILDATFDDVLPLAIERMPKAIECLVRTAIREHLNLNIADQLNKYDGRVLLVRRTEDEIMCTPHSALSYNRGGDLLTKMLMRRYPQLFVDSHESHVALKEFLAVAHDTSTVKEELITKSNDEECQQEIKSFNEKWVQDKTNKYPSRLGEGISSKKKAKLVLYLAQNYMVDQASQHCQTLATDLFQPGWDHTIMPTAKKI